MPQENRKSVLTPLEFEIMQVLWTHGSSTVSEVQPHLRGDLAYTSVQTMLIVLLKKRKVKRVLEGKAYRYSPVVSRSHAYRGAIKEFTNRVFGGSSEALLMAMVDVKQIDVADLARIAAKLSEPQTEMKEEEE